MPDIVDHASDGEQPGSGEGPERLEAAPTMGAVSAYHEERIKAILGTALVYSPTHYWDFVYGALFESQKACEDDAARSHRIRLNELGFPDRDTAMEIYRPLPCDSVALPPDTLDDDHESDARRARRSNLLPAQLDGTAFGRALAELPQERAPEVFRDLLSVANALAVADELPLADPDSVTGSLRKALRGIALGLVELARSRDQAPSVVLAGAAVEDLFRVGAASNEILRPRKTLAELEAAEAGDDWNVRTEVISEADRVLGEDGKVGR